jgi:glucose-6-phosphate 1-epimerase
MQAAHPNKFRHRTTTFHGQPASQLTAPDGSEAIVLMQGAHLVSWKTAGGVERLFLSDQAVYAPSTAVRGGVPVVFPQFAHRGSLPKHGFARTQEWALQSVDTTETDALLVLRLASNASTRNIWPFAFELELSLRLSSQRLDIELAVVNTGDQPLSFTAALHTYLRVGEISGLSMEGLQRLRFSDSITRTEQIDNDGLLRVSGELDRIYFDVNKPLILRCSDGVMDRTQVSQVGFEDVVVWNPGPEQASSLLDMSDGGWRQMICIEAAQIGSPVQLMPNEDWCGRQSIDCGSL